MESIYVLSFESTHKALQAEKKLKEEGMNIMVMPTPREITASCGISLGFSLEKIEEVNALIKNEEIDPFGIFKVTKIGAGKKSVEKID